MGRKLPALGSDSAGECVGQRSSQFGCRVYGVEGLGFRVYRV